MCRIRHLIATHYGEACRTWRFYARGAVNISGSKNASLPILAASLLTDEPVVVRRVPDVSDTNFMVQIMGQLGASVERSSGNVRVEARSLHSEAAYEQVRKMRASICLMGPLMARMQRCVIPLPGGCVIGDRPVDLHIRAIQALGAQVQIERGNLIIEAPRGLKGATVDLSGDHGPTVLGTDNLMMAAVLAEGTTVIESAASEPEVVDLANFLIKMGANIQGAERAGSSLREWKSSVAATIPLSRTALRPAPLWWRRP